MATNSKNQFATKDDLKKLRGELKEDFKNYTGILYERFSDQVQVIAEQNSDIKKELKKINNHLEVSDGRLDKLEIKTDVLIETVAEIKVDTTAIREELENKTDVIEHKKLAHRVAVLESRA